MNHKVIIASAAALSLASAAFAQNPVIRDQFTADPTARVFEGKVYVYPSHDIISPVEPERKWFSMADYHVFSSEDLIDWQDHGVILSQENVPWGNPEGYSMWAPDCVYKNGKYYFYFPNAPKSGRGFAVGVAVADKPYGPFDKSLILKWSERTVAHCVCKSLGLVLNPWICKVELSFPFENKWSFLESGREVGIKSYRLAIQLKHIVIELASPESHSGPVNIGIAV